MFAKNRIITSNIGINRTNQQHRTLTASTTTNKKSQQRKQHSRQQQQHQQQQPELAKKKILFQSLGCPRNFVDTEVMLGISISEGDMEITQSVEDADVIVVNTCGFLQTARDESRTAIQDMISMKNTNSKLLVTGCMVNLKNQQEQILTDFPDVDAILPSGEIDQVVETINGLDISNKRIGKKKNKNGKVKIDKSVTQHHHENNDESTSSSSSSSHNNNQAEVTVNHSLKPDRHQDFWRHHHIMHTSKLQRVVGSNAPFVSYPN